MRVITSIDELFELPGKSIGFFGGSFDPPHFGHLVFIKQAKALQKLEHIIVCPHSHNKHKNLAEIAHRLRMMDLLFETLEDSPIYVLSPNVCQGIQNKFFVDDILYLLKRHKKEVYVLAGCDSLDHCIALFKPLKIPFIVGCRVRRSEAEKKFIAQGCTCIFIDDVFPCSSSKIKEEPNLRDIYLPPEVISYIEKNHLYWASDALLGKN